MYYVCMYVKINKIDENVSQSTFYLKSRPLSRAFSYKSSHGAGKVPTVGKERKSDRRGGRKRRRRRRRRRSVRIWEKRLN